LRWRCVAIKRNFNFLINYLVPDELITKALTDRLGQMDAVKRGWVLHGFPKTRNQLDSLAELGYEPNRVVVLDIPSDTAVERLSLRSVDPETGHR